MSKTSVRLCKAVQGYIELCTIKRKDESQYCARLCNPVQSNAWQCMFETSVRLCNAVQGYAELCMFEVSVKLCNAVQCYAELCTIPHKLIKMSVNISTIYISKKY